MFNFVDSGQHLTSTNTISCQSYQISDQNIICSSWDITPVLDFFSNIYDLAMTIAELCIIITGFIFLFWLIFSFIKLIRA